MTQNAIDARIAVLMLALLATAGCGSRSRAATPAVNPDARVEVTLAVHSRKQTNGGRPLHVIVRSVDEKTYAADSYTTIADLVSRQDASVLATFVVFPGHQARTKLQVSARSPVAVYFLFTNPGKRWRQLIDVPLDRRIELRLAGASIQEDDGD